MTDFNTYKSFFNKPFRYIKEKFDLTADSAVQNEVIENVTKGVEFRGTNLWVLIFAVFIASLGLNVNSTAVIIGAMCVSPLMGPIIGIGLSLGVNDFELMKKAFRNFLLMIIVGILTSTVYFMISPLSNAQSELLARTNPTTYDVLIAFFGGLAGMVAQTRKDRTSTVIPGVAIATALMPPLCTAGYGLGTGQLKFFFGAFYLFIIIAVFLEVASYVVVRLLGFDKKVFVKKAKEKRVHMYMSTIAILALVPSVILSFRIVNQTVFEQNADRYVASVFQFSKTMIVNYDKRYKSNGKKSVIDVKLVGEPLSQNVIDNARSLMGDYGLRNTELVIRQADAVEKVDLATIQKSYYEILEEKNELIAGLEDRLSKLTTADTMSVRDISHEVCLVADNIASASLSKHVTYDSQGEPKDTTVVCVIHPADRNARVDLARVDRWLKARTKNSNIRIYTE